MCITVSISKGEAGGDSTSCKVDEHNGTGVSGGAIDNLPSPFKQALT